MELIILTLLFAYILGSIPSAVWIGKTFYNIDVRNHGSGNAGATNTFRVLGWKPGIIVFIIDTIKGFMAVYLLNFTPAVTKEYVTLLLIAAAIFAVVGHIFPLFARFKGGKGVATMLGVVLAIHPVAGIWALGAFIVIFLIFQYVSLGSLVAGIVFPTVIFLFYPEEDIYMKIFAVLLTLLLFFSHRANIKRLIKGTENKVKIYGKR